MKTTSNREPRTRGKADSQPYPIYVIHLKRVPERKLFMQRQLDALQLDYEFVDAIDKYDLHSPEYRSKLDRTLGLRKVSTSVFNACGLSHIKVYNLMIERNQSVACVLEDDAVLSTDFPDILRASQEISWDILLLSSQSVSIRRTLTCDIEVRNLMEKSPERNCSLFPVLRHTKWFRKIYPLLFGSWFYPKWTVASQIGWWMLMFLSYSRNANRLFKLFNAVYYRIRTKGIGISDGWYVACRIGGLPIRSSQQTLYGAYDIATPAEIPTSAMGYLLSLEMAHKCKQCFNQFRMYIDIIPWHLHLKDGVRLKLVTPSCVAASLVYLMQSARQGGPVT